MTCLLHVFLTPLCLLRFSLSALSLNHSSGLVFRIRYQFAGDVFFFFFLVGMGQPRSHNYNIKMWGFMALKWLEDNVNILPCFFLHLPLYRTARGGGGKVAL